VSDSETHTEKTVNTATCTADGETITTCTVEGCPYEVKTPATKLGHDWDTEHPEGEANHLHGATVKCKREGCTETKETATVPHTYDWTCKNETTHTGKCNGADCAQVPGAEEPHNFTTEKVNNFTVYTCGDCGAEYADFKVTVYVAGTGADINKQVAYTEESVKVALYKYEDGEHVKVCEADTDAATGVANFQIARGSYLVGVDNADHTVAYREAVEAVFLTDKDHETLSTETDIHISKTTKEYTYKIYYGAGTEHPAQGVQVSVVPQTSVKNPMEITHGTTDGNGGFTFQVSDNIASVTTSSLALKISGYDTENYYYTVFDSVRDSTAHDIEAHLLPKVLTHTVNVAAGDEKIVGVKVKLTNTVYNAEAGAFEDEVIAEGVTDENGAFTTAQPLDNTLSYKIVIDLTETDYEAIYKVPAYIPGADSLTGERTIELVRKDPTYIFSLTDKVSEITLTVKNSEGTVVAEGKTNDDGKFLVALPFEEYTVEVDNEELLAKNYTAKSTVITVPTVGTNGKTTLKSDNTVSEGMISVNAIVSKSVTVKYGTEPKEGVIVKIYLDGELAFTSEPTVADGTTTLKFINSTTYSFSLEGEGMPANTVCGTAPAKLRSSGTTNITIVDSANFNLTLKDKEGNAISGAKVTFCTVADTTNKLVETASVSGVTAADGTVTIPAPLKTYYIGAVGENGTKYWCNGSVTATEKGETVSKELTMYSYDSVDYAAGFDTAKANLGTDILTAIFYRVDESKNKTYQHSEVFSFGGLEAGKYTITVNPDDYDFTYMFEYNYDNGTYGTVVDADDVTDNDYLVFHKDGNRRITSIEWTYDGTSATWFKCTMSAENDGKHHKLTVRVDKAEG
ncbi:MAG: hypothetical protein NC131_07930, partial [Roseburia sp.]|nr:hypothetical protein [Roseburia sp.]